MKGALLDEIMVRFAAGAHDVLLTTDIVEAGLDIPNANTILVWRADRFGVLTGPAARLARLVEGRSPRRTWKSWVDSRVFLHDLRAEPDEAHLQSHERSYGRCVQQVLNLIRPPW